jgi:Tfp pilus assembly protein PilO
MERWRPWLSAVRDRVAEGWAWLARSVDASEWPQAVRMLLRPWPLFIVAAVGVGVLVFASIELNVQLDSVKRLDRRLAELSIAPVLPAASAPEPVVDFTAELPAVIDVAPVVAELQRSASSEGVVMQEVQSLPKEATETQLAATELMVQLRGAYPGIKNVLRDVLGRYRHVTVRRLSIRKSGAPQNLQADVLLVLWGRPVPSRTEPAAGGPGS